MRPEFYRIVIGLVLIVLSSCANETEKKHADNDDVYMQLGVRYLNINKLTLAKENLELALKDDSNSVPANNAMAFLYEKLNKYDEAKSYYETAYNLDPESIDVLNNYGRFLCDRREFEKGMNYLSQAIANRLNDKLWLALTNAGRCQMSMGDLQKAQTYFQQALEVNAEYAPALMEMQKISYQNGNYKAAKDYFQQYMKVGFYSPETLWIAIQTERALGNEAQAKDYQDNLLEKFPNSNETKQIKSALGLP